MRKTAVMIFKGLRFGMLLQLAVGPVFFLTLRASAASGFAAGLQVTLAAALVDAVFVALSGAGAAVFIGRTKIKAAARWIGCLVLVLFGFSIILDAFGVQLLPGVRLFSASGGNFFTQGLVLTASNPLTILFWGGLFTAEAAQNQWNGRQLFLFAAGCVLSTALSLSAVAALGSVLGGVMPPLAAKILNAAIGVVLIFCGIRLLCKKDVARQP